MYSLACQKLLYLHKLIIINDFYKIKLTSQLDFNNSTMNYYYSLNRISLLIHIIFIKKIFSRNDKKMGTETDRKKNDTKNEQNEDLGIIIIYTTK